MPRPKRRKSRRAGYEQEHILHLLRGVYLHPGSAFATKPGGYDGDHTDDHAAYCMSHPPVSRRLAMYLSRVVQLEAERRRHEDNGAEVLEVSMSSICAEHWSNAELVAAMVKCSALREAAEGELYELVSKIYMVLFVEATERLDPRDEAGIGRGRNEGK